MEARTLTVLTVAEGLLGNIRPDAPPLSALNASLTELAEALGVDRVVVAIDDAQCGRQLFCSGRRPLGSSHVGLSGSPRVCTDPPVPIADEAQAVLVGVVRTAFWLALQSMRPGRQPAPEPTPECALAPPPSPTTARAYLDSLGAAVAGAAARAVRYGWGFTLVCARFDAPTGMITDLSADVSADVSADLGADLRAGLRAGDAVVDLGHTGFGLLLEAARDEQLPPIMARIARHADLPPLCYGLVHCPGDGTDADALIDEVFARLGQAQRANTVGAATIRAVGAYGR